MSMCVLHNAAKYGCDHQGAIIRIKIRLKGRLHPVSSSRFVVEHTNEGAPGCDASLRVAVSIVVEIKVHAAGNVELFVQTFVLHLYTQST